jgi:type III secretory pathway lipoprotein EscJ
MGAQVVDNERLHIAATRILAALDNDPAPIEHYDPAKIETLPVSVVIGRLAELGLPISIPAELQRLIAESSTPATFLLDLLADDDRPAPGDIERMSLSEVKARLQELGLSYRADLTELVGMPLEPAVNSISLVRQDRVAPFKAARIRDLSPLHKMVAACAAAIVVLFVTTVSVRIDESGLAAARAVLIDEQQRAQMIFALSQDLSRTVSEIDGVLSARVHLALPENEPLRQQPVASSASVFIRHQASTPMNDLVPRIKMLVANSVAGLSYDKVSVMLVPADAERVPKQEFTTLGEVFKRDGLVSSPVQERARMIFALSQQLSRTVSEIDGVLSARVHLVLPENDPLRQVSSASVFIRHQASTPMVDLVPQIKMMIANSVAGLSYDKVSVVLVPVDKGVEKDARIW